MNPENNIKRNFLCWLIGHKTRPACERCWAIIDVTFSEMFDKKEKSWLDDEETE